MIPVIHGVHRYGWFLRNQRMGVSWVLLTLLFNVTGATAYSPKVRWRPCWTDVMLLEWYWPWAGTWEMVQEEVWYRGSKSSDLPQYGGSGCSCWHEGVSASFWFCSYSWAVQSQMKLDTSVSIAKAKKSNRIWFQDWTVERVGAAACGTSELPGITSSNLEESSVLQTHRSEV